MGGSDSEDEGVARYKRGRKVGEGTYAVVFEATDTLTGARVAIKRIKMLPESAGLDISAVRELAALRTLVHPNIVPLLDVHAGKRSVSLILPFLDADLEQIIHDRRAVPVFDPADIKAWMLMVLRALAHMHATGHVHRDVKPSNLLLDAADGSLRLADFGLARRLPYAATPGRPMTPNVCTRWYRAPELLLGARHYGPAVDVWAAACVFAELLLRTPFLPGDTDVQQAALVCRALGHLPTTEEWPGRALLPNAALYDCAPESILAGSPLRSTRASLEGTFPAAPSDAIDVLEAMLRFDPSQRATAAEVLAMPYFAPETQPRPTPAHLLPRPSRTTLEESRRELSAGMAPRALRFR